MALSLDALHQPMNAFFLEHFATAASTHVVFRFDRFGSTLSPSDFEDPADPAAGWSAVMARERFSDLVNRIPVDAGDGASVVMTSDSVDSLWFDRLLGPAQPYLAPDAGAEERAEALRVFSLVKSRALRLWEDLSLESSSGLRSRFRVAEASPARWSDPTAQEVWTSTTFQVGSPTPPDTGTVEPVEAVDPEAEHLQWRLRASSTVLAEALAAPDLTALLVAEPAPVSAVAVALRAEPALALRAEPALRATALRRLVATEPDMVAPAGSSVDAPLLARAFDTATLRLDLTERLHVRQLVQEQAPSEAVTTSSVRVELEYCLVDVRREWLLDSLVNDDGWCIPGSDAGELTDPARRGSLPLLPVGMVVVRRLHISAAWSAADLALARSATSFGPFDITPDQATGRLDHEGPQVIGWMLQQLPPLPPQPVLAPDPAEPVVEPVVEPAEPATAEPRTHTVRRGDTLWAIAQAAYGDGARWPEIAHANGDLDPAALQVGAVLTLP